MGCIFFSFVLLHSHKATLHCKFNYIWPNYTTNWDILTFPAPFIITYLNQTIHQTSVINIKRKFTTGLYYVTLLFKICYDITLTLKLAVETLFPCVQFLCYWQLLSLFLFYYVHCNLYILIFFVTFCRIRLNNNLVRFSTVYFQHMRFSCISSIL